MSRELIRQRFSVRWPKTRGDEAGIDSEMLGTQQIRLRFCAGQKQEDRVNIFVDLGHIFLGHKLKPATYARVFQGFDVFLRAVKTKLIVEFCRRADFLSRLQDSKFSICGSYHNEFY